MQLCNDCDKSKFSMSEVGNSFELPDSIQDEQEAAEFLTGKDEFTIDEVEVFKVEQNAVIPPIPQPNPIIIPLNNYSDIVTN